MKKKILGIVLSLVVLLALILIMAPAKTIIPLIHSKLPNNLKSIKFGAIDGSIWSPRIASVEYQQYRVNNISTKINPLALMFGELKAELGVKDSKLELSGEINADSQRIISNNLDYKIQADILNPFMQFPIKALDGEFEGVIKEASIQQNGLWNDISGQGSWRNAVIYYMSASLQLGDLQYTIATDPENNIELKIIDNKGALDLKGSFVLTPAKSYRLDLTMSQQLPAEIETWVKQLGRLEDNRYRIQWNGKVH